MLKVTVLAVVAASAAGSPFLFRSTPAPNASEATPVVTYYVNFPFVPDNQAPNDWFTEVIFESNGHGWLESTGFSGENQNHVNVNLTSGSGSGSFQKVSFSYTVDFKVTSASTAKNQDEDGTDYDYDLYEVSNTASDEPWDFIDSSPEYTYKLTVPADEEAEDVDHRIYLRTFEDPTPTSEGYETVLLEITGVSFFGTPPLDTEIKLGDQTTMRWLIRDAVDTHTADDISPPSAGIIMQFSHSTPWMAGLDFPGLDAYSPATETISDPQRTQPSVKFITEGENDYINFGGPVTEDYFGIRFKGDDEVSDCPGTSQTEPLGCGGVPNDNNVESDCEFEITFQIDGNSTADHPGDYRIFDWLTGSEITPNGSGVFKSEVSFLPGTSETNSGHRLCIKAYKNTTGSEATYEDLIIHIVSAERLDSCTLDPEPEVGWSGMAMWIIENVP